MGTLYLVGTPIGNMEDITLRAMRVLREVPLIAAEDTRVTGRLLKRLEIETPLTSYHEHNKLTKLNTLLDHLERDDLALVSDAGMPGLSDPGYELVQAAVARGLPVLPIPGPSAVISALVVSGLPTDNFVYVGFIPRRPAARRKLLESLKTESRTLVAFESPHRLQATLADIRESWGERPVAVARELTKLYEEVQRGTPSELLEIFAQKSIKGEITLVMGGASPAESNDWDDRAIEQALDDLLQAGESPSAAAKAVAKLSGRSRREIYPLAIEKGAAYSPPPVSKD